MKRFYHIDFLRAIAILAVIVTHVFSYNLSSRQNFLIWNYSHFTIVAFVFCSGYVMFASYSQKIYSFSSVMNWYRKRLIRLLLPFYYYFVIHFALVLLFSRFFSGLGLKFSWQFILQSITFIGGIDLNWLPLLFIELALLFPLLILAFNKRKKIFWGYVSFAIIFTIISTIWQIPYKFYREIMWIPWSLFLILPWWFYKKENSLKVISLSFPLYFLISLIGFIFFIFLYFVWSHLGRSLTLIDNKYPPNFFYISYEVFGSFLLLGMSFLNLFKYKWILQIYQYISKSSYMLFFIHYIVLDFILSLNKMIGNQINVWEMLVGVIFGSLCVVWIINRFYNSIT